VLLLASAVLTTLDIPCTPLPPLLSCTRIYKIITVLRELQRCHRQSHFVSFPLRKFHASAMLQQPVDPDARAAMRAKCAAAGGASTAQGWEILWREGLTLWDLNGPTPALIDEVKVALSNGLLKANDTALVPGCGAAYDVVALAELGLRTTGVDIAREAVNRAKEILSLKKTEGGGGSALSVVSDCDVILSDFFDTNVFAPSTFDFIFDYTFFCAIAPHQRAEWGLRIATLLKPGSHLLTFAFPIDDDEKASDPSTPGPPHAVSIAQYKLALEKHDVHMIDGPRRAERSVRPTEMVVWWKKGGGGAEK
jgi:hypothetical protein